MPAVPAARSRWLHRLAVAAAIVAVVIACAIGVAPLLVDTDAVKRAVERRFAQSMGGEAAYESVSLNLFPRPHAEFSGATVRVPGVIDGRIARVQVGFAWLLLLAGDVRPMAIRIEHPVLELHVAPGQTADPLAAYRAALGPVADALTRHAAGVSVRIEKGEVTVVYGGRPFVSLSELDATLEVSSDAIVARASAASDLWRAARSEVRIAPATLAAAGKLQVSGLLAARLLGAQPSGDALRVRLDAADATLDAATDGSSTLRGSLTASAPQAEIARAGRTVGLGAIRIALDVSRDDNALAFALRELRAGDLIAEATGTLRAKPDGTAPVLELQVPVLDAERAGAAALALAGDFASVRAAVDGVRDGKLRELTLHSAAVDLAGLADPSRMRAEARLEAATVAVPAAGIVVTNGNGRFVLADGTLQGSELAGVIGGSSFSAGALAVQLLPAASLRGLRTAVTADLADALAITRHLLKDEDPTALAGIEALQGRASATVDYEAGRRASPLVVELKGIQATGRYRGVPFPLAVSRGDLRFAGDGVSARGVAGTAGGASVSNGAIDIVLGTEPVIRAAGGDATLVLGEVYPLVASLEHLQPVLGDIKSATGTASVHLVRLSGPLSKPGSLDFDLEVRPQQVQLTSFALPGPLTLASGFVSASSRALRLEQLQAALLDARVTASGTVEDYPAAERRVSLTLEQGSSGPEVVDWVRQRWKLPDDELPRAPVALSAGRLEWTGGARGALAVQGAASIAASVQAEFDLDWRSGRLDVRRFALKDSDSDAVFRLQWSPPAAELGFSGRLDYRTLERSLVRPPRTSVMLQGDFRAAIDLAEPRRSTAEGTLAVEGLDLQEHTGVPITIDRLHVEAAGRTLQVRDGVIRFAGERLALSGTVESREERLALDGRVSADALDGARLVSALRRDRAGEAPLGAEWKLPVEGRVALTAGSIAYGGYVLQPFAAVVSLAPNRVDVEATEARLCGIAAPFSAVLAPGNVTLSARLTARKQALAETVPCLAGDSVAVTGTYDLDAEFSANGPADSLAGAARGSFRFAARAGRILRSTTLSRALAVEEVAERTHAAPADMMAGGLAYDEIAVAGTLEDGRVRVEQGILDSPSLGMTVSGEVGLSDGTVAVQGLVAPLDTLHRAVRRVPVVGRAFGASLVVVPVSISGSVKDPEVKVLRAAAVGATLINLMTARFLMPVNLFDPTKDKYQIPSTQ